MMGLHKWLRGKDEDFDMTKDIPPIAKVEPNLVISRGPLTNEEVPKKPLPYHIAPVDPKLADDHALSQAFEQWKLDRQKTIEQLQADLKSEQRKSGLLELDIAQHVNNIATLQAQILALKAENDRYRNFFSVQKEINEKERLTYERFGIEAPPKKEKRNGKTSAPKDDGKKPDQEVAKAEPVVSETARKQKA